MSSIWGSLTTEEKDDLLTRRQYEDIVDLAKELGMYAPTLDRRLREWRQFKGQDINNEGEDQVAVKESPVTEEYPDTNHMVLTVNEPTRITTLDDLLAACKVDLSVWSVERYQVNKWEGYRKSERKNLRWSGGNIQEGYVEDDGTLHIEPLIQIKVWLVRTEPVAVEPVITPVRIAVPNRERIPNSMSLESAAFSRSLIVPDAQIGFVRDMASGKLQPMHDRIAMNVVHQVLEENNFDNVVFLGDWFDLADWSDKFIRSPEFEQVTQPALEEGAWWLAAFRASAPNANFYFIEGNHEKRLRDAIINHLPQAYHLKPVGNKMRWAAWELPYLLGLDDLGITWVGDYPNGKVWVSEDTCVIHGEGLNAKKVIDTHDFNVVFGHIHKSDLAARTITGKYGAKVISALCPGFVGRMDGVVPGHRDVQDWTQGFAVVYSSEAGDSLVHVPIVEQTGSAYFEGRFYSGTDPKENIKADLVRWNL